MAIIEIFINFAFSCTGKVCAMKIHREQEDELSITLQ